MVRCFSSARDSCVANPKSAIFCKPTDTLKEKASIYVYKHTAYFSYLTSVSGSILLIAHATEGGNKLKELKPMKNVRLW
jgi:hypothetical protein